jgi:hypothetical protein
VKKCASCSKDLPEAALHCVFCGAKQAPAPAVQPSGVAKTAFGYSANEVMQQLGNQQPPSYSPPAAAPRPHPGSQPPPYGAPPPAAANAKTMFAPPSAAPAPQQGYGAPQGYGANAMAPTLAQPGAAPGYGGGGYPQPGAAGMGIHSPQVSTPAPLPTVPSPYLGAQTGVNQAGRPIEPWRESLRLWMFVWGAIALAAFSTPISTDPMAFQWDAIIHGEGSAKIPGLVWAGVGLLAIVFGAIPMTALPRGALAAVLGLAGLFVPMLVSGHVGEWQELIMVVGALALVPGLLIRHEYTESLLARILVTIGAVCWLLPYLVPIGGQIPLVMYIKLLIDGANHMEVVIPALAQIVLAVVCLLVWMPGPATAGAKLLAWAVLLFPIVQFALLTINAGHLGDVVSKAPGKLLMWAPAVAYNVLVGYGVATVVGKQLE